MVPATGLGQVGLDGQQIALGNGPLLEELGPALAQHLRLPDRRRRFAPLGDQVPIFEHRQDLPLLHPIALVRPQGPDGGGEAAADVGPLPGKDGGRGGQRQVDIAEGGLGHLHRHQGFDLALALR
jgi:hypothetical protein